MSDREKLAKLMASKPELLKNLNVSIVRLYGLADHLLSNGATFERPKGRWVLTAHEESCNYRWNVTAECSECDHSKGEVYAGFFPDFPKNLARYTILNCAESVKLDNFCPNCGADMRGESE